MAGWGARQWLRVTKESTYGTYDGAADSSDVNWFRLPQSNPFDMRPVPQRQVIRSADGGNRRRQVVAARKVCSGTLNTLWYPTQAGKLLEGALTLSSNDLASYTLDYWDSAIARRFLGCKIQRLTLNGTATQDYIPASIQWVGQKLDSSAPTLTEPADTVFPSEVPYEHYESKGLMTVGATTQTKYSTLGITVSNVLAGTWDEDEWITNLYYCGRDVDLSIRKQYVDQTYRDALEAQSALTVSCAWARASGLTTTFDLQSESYVASVADDFPLDNATYQTVSIQTFYDSSGSTDVSFTVA